MHCKGSLLWSGAAALGLVLLADGFGHAGDAVHGQDIEKLFAKARTATGREYLRTRDTIVLMEAPARGFLEERRETGESWEEAVLADVLLERLAHEEEIKWSLDQGIEIPRNVRGSHWIRAVGKALAERFEQYPMFLVEFLWKRNELVNLRAGRAFPLRALLGDAAVAQALALLGERRAVRPLLQVLERESAEYGAKEYAGRALGMLRAKNVLPELMRIAESADDPGARRGAVSAMSGCLDAAALPLLRQAAARTQDANLAALYGTLALALEDDKTAPPRAAMPSRARGGAEQMVGSGTAPLVDGPGYGLLWLGLAIGLALGIVIGATAVGFARR